MVHPVHLYFKLREGDSLTQNSHFLYAYRLDEYVDRTRQGRKRVIYFSWTIIVWSGIRRKHARFLF